MSAYFVTAIGTGVGKTFTTCALLHAAKQHGPVMRAYKPVISGWDDSTTTDTAQIIAAAGVRMTGDEQRLIAGRHEIIDDISPWRFAAPLSPHRAAALEGKAIALEALVAWSRARAQMPGLTLIEGVGGVMAPLTNQATVLDWMRTLQLPVILVTGSYLGSISHTLTALEVLDGAGLQVKALVMNESAGSEVEFAEAQLGLAPFVETIALRIFQPRVSSWAEASAIAGLLPHL